MELDRRLAREFAPFAVATALGYALVPATTQVDWAEYALATGLAIAVALLVVLTPWRRVAPMLRVVPALLFLVAAGFLRHASGVGGGVGALILIPVFWLALHGSRAQLLILVAGVIVFFLSPTVTGDSGYPFAVWWRTALVFGAASAVVGLAVQNLVGRVRSNAAALAVRERDLEAVADLLRSLSLVTDARERICAAASDLSGARFAVLLEGDGEEMLTATAVAGDVPDLDGPERPAAILFEPVLHGEEVAGVLVAGWAEQPADERRARGLVRLLASEAAFVIERADLLRRLTEFALTDDLTGLPNRRAWDERVERAIRDGEPVCIAILDLDRFKVYNDDHGHQAGDRFLEEAAAAWRAQLRPTDTLARYGGEEFVVLLPETDLETARGVVDRLRAATPVGQSCSAGIARREDDETAAALLDRADKALYDAKRAGRDRSLVAEPGPASGRASGRLGLA